jgi:hypothetical protein
MTALQGQLTRAEWGTLGAWVVATAVGWVVGFAICEAFSAFLKSLNSDGLVIGAGIGIAQWLVLRRQAGGAGWWILASIVGFGIGKVLGDPVAANLGGFVGSALGGATIGLAAGALLWIALLRLGADPGMWLVASTVGWGVGWLLIGSIDESNGAPGPSAYLVGAAGAAIAGVITGVSMVRLLRTRAPAQP